MSFDNEWKVGPVGKPAVPLLALGRTVWQWVDCVPQGPGLQDRLSKSFLCLFFVVVVLKKQTKKRPEEEKGTVNSQVVKWKHFLTIYLGLRSITLNITCKMSSET